jgi:UDP-N-acetylmuramate dehydrogenase
VTVASALETLRAELDGDVAADEPMARHTTYRIGGPASMFVTCETLHDLKRAVETLRAEGIPAVVLGKGSNVLVADEGYEGAVLVLGREFKRHEITEGHLRAGAACALAALVQEAFSKGLSGLEFAVGVPGTLGGALAMNAGTRDDWIGENVERLVLFAPGEGLLELRGHEIDWGYRNSDVSRRGIAVECDLKVSDGDKDAIRRTMDASFARRKRSQPIGVPSAGSVFRNPEGDSAGRLIEEVGLKGARRGGARISTVHANFIVNEGGASARDVWDLVTEARTAVRDVYGIRLQTEIKLLGPVEGS